jgi:hypothetical protein
MTEDKDSFWVWKPWVAENELALMGIKRHVGFN